MWDRVTVSIPPTEMPISLIEAKAQCRIDDTDDDDLLTLFINSATKRIDGPQGIGLACSTQSWELSLDCFPSGSIHLPGWPVKSVTSVVYTDGDGNSQTMDPGDYTLDIKGDRARLSPLYNVSWPQVRLENSAVEIIYVVGEDAADISADLKLALLLLVSHYYEHREAVDIEMHKMPLGVEFILGEYSRGQINA